MIRDPIAFSSATEVNSSSHDKFQVRLFCAPYLIFSLQQHLAISTLLRIFTRMVMAKGLGSKVQQSGVESGRAESCPERGETSWREMLSSPASVVTHFDSRI